MVNDSLSDFVTRIRNGYLAHLDQVSLRSTKFIAAFAAVLVKSGYVESVKNEDGELTVTLKYDGKGEPAITGIRRISTPGSRVYRPIADLPRVWGGLGISILSTPKGILTGASAKKLNVGGEVLAQVW